MSDATDEVPMDRLAKVYLKIRTKIQELERAHEAQLEELKQQRDVIALQMKDMMLALGSKSVKTDAGTVILSQKTRYYASDWDEMKKFILSSPPSSFEMASCSRRTTREGSLVLLRYASRNAAMVSSLSPGTLAAAESAASASAFGSVTPVGSAPNGSGT